MIGRPKAPTELLAMLAGLGIATTTVDHPPLFTVEDSKNLRGDLPGGHCKNLFLRNKKSGMWLVVCPEDRVLHLKTLGALLGAGSMSFASPERLMAFLGVTPGAVSPFAVINDPESAVQVVLDEEMMRENLLNYHPLTNEQTTAITPGDLLTFLKAAGHSPQIVDLT